jgi:hypothetical protein
MGAVMANFLLNWGLFVCFACVLLCCVVKIGGFTGKLVGAMFLDTQ